MLFAKKFLFTFTQDDISSWWSVRVYHVKCIHMSLASSQLCSAGFMHTFRLKYMYTLCLKNPFPGIFLTAYIFSSR